MLVGRRVIKNLVKGAGLPGRRWVVQSRSYRGSARGDMALYTFKCQAVAAATLTGVTALAGGYCFRKRTALKAWIEDHLESRANEKPNEVDSITLFGL